LAAIMKCFPPPMFLTESIVPISSINPVNMLAYSILST
jgi:hypothetical protein